jgi:ABC-type transporter Mla maintaining outer membrane lipid asymmetry ATPase subunit MlaF
MMSVEQLVKLLARETGEIEVLEENLHQCNSVHRKSWKPATNRLYYGTALYLKLSLFHL